MGYAVVMFEATVVTAVVRRCRPSTLLISQLSAVVGWVTVAWLVLRWADLISARCRALAFAGDVKATMFWIENALFVGAALVFVTPAGAPAPRASFVAAVALLARRIALPSRCLI